MSKILISYRREDSTDATGRIFDRLVQQFGRAAVFKDVDSIPLGINFRKYLDEQVAKCDVFLAVIGPDWIGVKASEGKSRLDDPRDFVRIEIESALKRQIPVIPVLVRGASIPDPERLPSSLQELLERNGIVVRHDPDFHRDMDRLIEHLRVQIEEQLEQAPFSDAHQKTNEVRARTQEIHAEVELPELERIDAAVPPAKVAPPQRLVEPIEKVLATSTPALQKTTDQPQSYLFGVIGLVVLIGAVAAFLILQSTSLPVEPIRYEPPRVVEKREERPAQAIPSPASPRPSESTVVTKKQERPVEKRVMVSRPPKVAEKNEESATKEVLMPPSSRSSQPGAVPQKQDTTVEKQVTTGMPSIPNPEMIRISPASFMMGSSKSQDETPIHDVTFAKPFAITRYETTFDEYDRFAQVTARPLPKDEGWGHGSRPVINVSWNDATAYAQWLSQQTGKRYRLPTEAEWEYAARSGGQDQMWAGTSDESQLKDYAVYHTQRTEPVGSKKPNGLGLYDMSGNVWEWVDDCWHVNYMDAPPDGTPWLEKNGGNCARRVIRGGSWDFVPGDLRASDRGWDFAVGRSDLIGFRLVQDLP